MPYEAADEEKFYQEKAKPGLEKIAQSVVDEVGLDATNQDVLTKIKSIIGEKWEKAKRDVMRWLREEFEAFKQMIRDATIFQIPYKAKSKGPYGKTLVPKNQAYAMEQALDDIERKHGNIDDWVMKELAYPNREALYKAFAAEQIDALAMAIENINDKAGMILGDQTGVGKGRVVAGMIRWANQKGLVPIFVTEKPNLFSDMYRDLTAIDHKIKPFIMNNDVKANIVNQETGEVLISHGADGKGKLVYNGGRINWDRITENPQAYLAENNMKAIFTTYSQHQSGEFKNQDSILNRMAPNNILVLDESHNATGAADGSDSNTKVKFLSFLQHADGVLYSSATFAKTPHNMALYYRTALGDTGMQFFELVDAIVRGGNPLQEYISAALAKGGQYLRRELDFSGINYFKTPTMQNTDKTDPSYPELEKAFERDKSITDKSNNVVRQIMAFSNDFRGRANSSRLNALLAVRGYMIGQGTGPARLSATATNFASVVHNFNSQLLMSTKVDRTINETEKALKEGKKVVINLMNTMGSFLDDMVRLGMAEEGKPIEFTYRSVLERALRNSLRVTVKNGFGDKTRLMISPDELRQFMPAVYNEYVKALNMINTYDVKGLHASPIDYMLSELERISGKPVTELTNRDYTINYTDKDGKPIDTPILGRREAHTRDRQRAIRLFNTGKSDVIIINRAGSVGISLHASEDFSDQKPRRMLILQPNLDINIYMQALGRIFRKGQVVNPDYVYVTSDLPSEIRPAVILERKMSSLKANTTAKQKGAESRKEIPDMMNRYGNEITRAWLNRNKQVAIQLGIIQSQNQSIPTDTSTDYAAVAGKLTVLPVELQKDFYNEVENDYDSYIQELTAKGENELISKNYDYQAKIIDKSQIYQGLDPESPFSGNVYREVLQVRQLKKPFNMVKIKDLISKIIGTKSGQDYSTELFEKVKQSRTEYWQKWESKLAEKYENNTERMSRARQERQAYLNAEQETYRSLLNYMHIGDYYEIPLGEGSQENIRGVLTNIIWSPTTDSNPIQLSRLKFVFSVQDPVQTVVYNASQSWFRDEAYRLQKGIPVNWDSTLPTDRTEEKVVLTGNMLRAFNIMSHLPEIKFEMVNFSRENGVKEFGLVIARKHEDIIRQWDPQSLGREVAWQEAHVYLTDRTVDLERIVTSTNNEITIQSEFTTKRDKKDATSNNVLEYRVSVPASTQLGAKYFQDDALRSFVRNNNFRKMGNRMIANMDFDKLEGFMKALHDKFGMKFTLPRDTAQVTAPMPSFIPTNPDTQEEVLRAPFVASIKDFSDKFFDNPAEAVPDKFIKEEIRPFLKSQNDFKNVDKYASLPWWNAKKYPAWRRAFEIFGIQRPERRGTLTHGFAQIAEPFFRLEEVMRKAGKTSKEIADAKDRINRVIVTGDAQLGPYLKSLKRQVKGMAEGPLKDRLQARIDQLTRDNRYADDQLLKGIKDDRGNMVKLSQEEITVYKSVRQALDNMFDAYVDHLQSMAFRTWSKQKWYAVLLQAAGMDFNKTQTAQIVGAGLDKAAQLRALKIQPDIKRIFERVEQQIEKTPDADKIAAGEWFGKISDTMVAEIASLQKALSTLTGITDQAKLTSMSRQILAAYMMTRPQLKKIKTLRNLYKKQVAFFPRVREQGDYKMTVNEIIYNEEGLPVKERKLFMGMFDNEKEAAKMYADALARYGKNGALPENIRINVEKATKTPEFAFQGVNDINMQKVLDNAIESMHVRETFKNDKGETINVQDYLRELGYQAIAKQFQSRGFGRHMTHRQAGAIKGYKESDLQRVLFNYMTGMAGIMTKQESAADFLEHMKEVSKENNPKMFEALSKYGRDQLRNETSADKFSNKIRAFMFTWYLGGLLRPALIQLTQNFVTAIPEFSKYLRKINRGGAGVAEKAYSKAMKDVAFRNYTEIEKRMQDQLFTEGVTVDQYIREIYGAIGTRAEQRFEKVLRWMAVPFSKMEMFNRQSAALTMFRPVYELALKEGSTEDEAYEKAFEAARNFVYDTHYAMGKANLPQIAQGEGIGTAVKTLYTFKSFTHNYVLEMRHNLSEGDFKTVMHSLAYIALFGGLMGLPFIKDLFEFAEKHFGWSFTKSVRQSLRGIGGKTLENFGMNGLPALFGANLSGSLAIGVPFMGEDSLATLGGVYEGQLKKMGQAVEAAGRKDYYRVATNMAPEFLRNPLVAAEESEIGRKAFGTPGVSSTTRGRMIYDENGKPLSMSAGQAALKTVGFTPTEIARQREKDQIVRRQETYIQELKTDAGEKYRIARLNGEPKALSNMMKDVKEINTKIKDRGLDGLVPRATVQKIIAASKESQTKKQIKEARYKRTEL